MSEDLRRLGTLTAPTPVSAFLTEVWPTRLHVSHDAPPALAPLIDQPELRDIRAFCGVPKQGYLRIDYTREAEYRAERTEDIDHAVRAFHAGNTIYVTDLQTEEIKRWNRSLDAALGLLPGTSLVNAFSSLPGRGLPWHWDAQELFIVQVRGRKRWYVAPNELVEWPTVTGFPTERPSAALRMELREPDRPIRPPASWQTVEMGPGSVMFLPRGYWHHVPENVEESLHLVLQVRMTCWRDVLRFILDNAPALHDLDWRRPSRALRPEALLTDAPIELAARLATLAQFATPAGMMELVAQFLKMTERGESFTKLAAY